MRFLRGPLSPDEAEAKMRRYSEAARDAGICRWAVEDTAGDLLGYCGVMPQCDPEHPLGVHYDNGVEPVPSCVGPWVRR